MSVTAPLSSHDIISTPVPFPTIPLYVPPKNERPWIQRHWYVILILECIILFIAFCVLLVYYLFFVRTPGKRISQDKVDNDGLSHHGSSVAASSTRASSRDSSTSKRSFEDDSTADGAVEQRQGGSARRSRGSSKRRFVLKKR